MWLKLLYVDKSVLWSKVVKSGFIHLTSPHLTSPLGIHNQYDLAKYMYFTIKPCAVYCV